MPIILSFFGFYLLPILMNRLIKKTFLFLFIFIIVSFVSFILLNEKPNFSINYYQPNLSKRFLSKINEFEN